jgi:hypothetical protein
MIIGMIERAAALSEVERDAARARIYYTVGKATDNIRRVP